MQVKIRFAFLSIILMGSLALSVIFSKTKERRTLEET